MDETNSYRPTDATLDREPGVSSPSFSVARRAILACGAICFVVGWLSRSFRAAASNGVHYEMLAAIFVQFAIVFVVAVAFRSQLVRGVIR